MRVIAGSHKGRRLLNIKGVHLRPTSGRVKEALFSILTPYMQSARFLDLYAGTGAIGIEALSRGARQATFVEADPAAVRLLRANLARCQLLAISQVYPCSAERFLQRAELQGLTFDIVFADPPYQHAVDLLPSLGRSAIITPDTIVVLEHPTRHPLPDRINRLVRHRQYRYGDTSLTVFGVTAEELPAS